MTTPDPRRSGAWRKTRAALIAAAVESPTPIICWRCEQPIEDLSNDAVDLGHLIDHAVAEPGTTAAVRLEHRSCNRSAGLALQREMTRRPRHRSIAWVTSEPWGPERQLYYPDNSR